MEKNEVTILPPAVPDMSSCYSKRLVLICNQHHLAVDLRFAYADLVQFMYDPG